MNLCRMIVARLSGLLNPCNRLCDSDPSLGSGEERWARRPGTRSRPSRRSRMVDIQRIVEDVFNSPVLGHSTVLQRAAGVLNAPERILHERLSPELRIVNLLATFRSSSASAKQRPTIGFVFKMVDVSSSSSTCLRNRSFPRSSSAKRSARRLRGLSVSASITPTIPCKFDYKNRQTGPLYDGRLVRFVIQGCGAKTHISSPDEARETKTVIAVLCECGKEGDPGSPI